MSDDEIPEGTLFHDLAEFDRAAHELFNGIAEALHIPQMLDLLTRTLTRKAPK